MKKWILTIGVVIMLIAAFVCRAQSQEGVITYETKINMHRRLPPDHPELKTMLPEFRSSNEQLFFNGTETLYKPIIVDEEEEEHGGGGFQIHMAQPYHETYFNQESQLLLSKQEFMGKNYLIHDTLKIAPWKFGEETRTIQGYACKQAYYTNEENQQTITAWYTDQLRSFMGPELFNTLPGAVLAVDVNNEERVIVAVTVELRPLKKNELKVPRGGQEMTRADFKTMMDEQIKKMGGNGIVIRN